MNKPLPWSEACERNREPILEVLRHYLPLSGDVLEIGSCTGQHVVYFAPGFPEIQWQPSDCAEYLDVLNQRLDAEGSGNIRDAVELDVLGEWPDEKFDVVYSANTAHIMSWEAVRALFTGVGERLLKDGAFCLYGPFNEHGKYTAPSNEAFDRHLKAQDSKMGIRDIEALDSLAGKHHLRRIARHDMPANNMILVFRKTRG